MVRRNIATKVIAKKMIEGYFIIETACTNCGMPLMELDGAVDCVVCPELAESSEKLQELNLTEQLRVKKLAEKQKLAEELNKKREEERKARELRQKEEEEARMKALAERKTVEEMRATKEKEEMEKLLATLDELEAEAEDKNGEAKIIENERLTAVTAPSTLTAEAGSESQFTDVCLSVEADSEALKIRTLEVENHLEVNQHESTPKEDEMAIVAPTSTLKELDAEVEDKQLEAKTIENERVAAAPAPQFTATCLPVAVGGEPKEDEKAIAPLPADGETSYESTFTVKCLSAEVECEISEIEQKESTFAVKCLSAEVECEISEIEHSQPIDSEEHYEEDKTLTAATAQRKEQLQEEAIKKTSEEHANQRVLSYSDQVDIHLEVLKRKIEDQKMQLLDESEKGRPAFSEEVSQKEEQEGKGIEQMTQQEGFPMEHFKQEHHSVLKDKKRLDVVSAEVPWLDEMKAVTQQARKLEEAASVYAKVTESSKVSAPQVRTEKEAAGLKGEQAGKGIGQMIQQEGFPMEHLKQENQSVLKDQKRLDVIDAEVPWLEEMRAVTQKARKLEETASLYVKVSESPKVSETQVKATKDAVVIEERQKREEERRLRQEKALKDKASIEKTKKDRLEAAKRRVEETARAEAVLMAKLKEESEAAKIAIDYAKKLSTPSGQGKQPLSYFFCSNTPEKRGNGENIEDEWDARCKKALASIPSRLTQGWKETDLHCLGSKCAAMPLLTFRSSSPYCIVCGGCGSGKDGLYKKITNSTPPVSPSRVSPSRSGRRKASTPVIPKMFEFVKVQPNNIGQPAVLPLVSKMLSEAGGVEEGKHKGPIKEGSMHILDPNAAPEEHVKPVESVIFETSLAVDTREAIEDAIKSDGAIIKADNGIKPSPDETRDAIENQSKNFMRSEEFSKPAEFITFSESGLNPAEGTEELNNNNDALNHEPGQMTEKNMSNKPERLMIQIPTVDEFGIIVAKQEREDEEHRQDHNTTKLDDTRERSDPLPSLPHQRALSVVKGSSTPPIEILELFDIKDLSSPYPGKRLATPRTPARARPNFFDEYTDNSAINKYKLPPTSKKNCVQVVRNDNIESKVPASDDDATLASIMDEINQIKLKLKSSDIERDVFPLSDKSEIDNLIERLSSAALAMKKLDHLS